ncbi:MAG: hypothetical protein ACOCWI_02675 [Bacillota bacterium]
MAEFANYYLEFLWHLGENIGKFFSTIFSAIANIFSRDIPEYFYNLAQAVNGFDVLGWITLFLVSIINVALIALICYRVFLSLRKYVFIRHREVEKEELLEEITKLKDQTEQLALEKNKIFSLKLNELNAFSGEIGDIEKEIEEKVEEGRFSKLAALDKKYTNNPSFVNMSDEDMLSLPELVKRFVYFAASQMKLYYKPQQIRQFFAGMATSKVIIIEGISGTGKTSLPYAVSKFFFNNALMISVQPSWRERSDLLGYLNEFTKKFNETDFLKGLYEATYRDDMNFIVLDEMNLARIEYYFAEFLSIMEMPDTSEWKIDLVPNPESTDPKNIVDGKLTVPQNLWFVGTANQDDSTFTITDKVYDRAITVEMNEKGKYFDAPVTNPVNISYDYMESLFDKALSESAISQEALKKIEKLDDFLQNKIKISFGNRILNQIKTFVPVYMGCGGTENEALDFMFLSKILKKFSSLNLVFLVKELGELVTLIEKLFGKGSFPASVAYIKKLQKTI